MVIEEFVARLGFQVEGMSMLRRVALWWKRLTARLTGFARTITRNLGRAGRVMARFIGLMARGLVRAIVRGTLAMAGLGTSVSTLTAGLAALANRVANVRAETVRLGQSAGINVGKLEALAQAMSLGGVDLKTARSTLTEWSDTLRKEIVEGGDLVDELSRLGVRIFDGAGKNRQLRDPANIFRDYIGALERIKTEIEKLRSLDRAGIDDHNVRAVALRGGAALDEGIVSASRLGVLFTKEQAEQAKQFSDATSKIGAALEGIGKAAANKAIEELLPLMQDLAAWFEGEGGLALRNGAQLISETVVGAFKALLDVIRAIDATLTAVVNSIKWLNSLFTVQEQRFTPPTARAPGEPALSQRLLEGPEPNEPEEWRKRRQEKARRMLEDDRQRGIDPTVNPLLDRLRSFFGLFSSAEPAVRQELNPATVANKMAAEQETKQAVDNRRYENVGNDNRNVSVNVNANVSGMEGLKSSILNSLGSALSKSSNASTNFATQP